MGRVCLEYIPIGAGNIAEYDIDEAEADAEEFEHDEDDDFKGSIFVCRGCHAHLTSGSELISKDFRGRSGKAYLFNSVLNFNCGVAEDRQLITGLHTISDIFCFECNKPLGWKYIHAFDERQAYKIGKVILEAAYIRKMPDARPKQPSQANSGRSPGS